MQLYVLLFYVTNVRFLCAFANSAIVYRINWRNLINAHVLHDVHT
jgi:hypothetical protein